jgi:uncharacterized protein (TIGR03089 family)
MGGFVGQVGNSGPSLFAAIVAAEPSLPLLTHYDDATGERTELSGATLANWVAKTANMLVYDGSSHATVWLPPHWQTAAVLLGSWTAGLSVAYGEPSGTDSDVVFASLEAISAGAPYVSADRYALGLAPMGQPLREVPDGWSDYISSVRQHGDVFSGPSIAESNVALIDPDGTPVSHSALLDRARQRASELGMSPGGRVLVDADAFPYPLDWLLAPLSVGASLVLCTRCDSAALPGRAETEQAVLARLGEPLEGEQ